MSIVAIPEETLESKNLFLRAQELINRNNYDEAVSTLEQALLIAPNNATYLSHFGFCVAVARKDMDTAFRFCNRAVKLEPKNPVHRVNLGKVHKLKGDIQTAYGHFLRAWKADRTHPMAATELQRMGIRRPPVIPFFSRSSWINVQLGRLRAKIYRFG